MLLDILTANFVAIESDNTSFPYDLKCLGRCFARSEYFTARPYFLTQESRLRSGRQRDRDARAHGRFQRSGKIQLEPRTQTNVQLPTAVLFSAGRFYSKRTFS